MSSEKRRSEHQTDMTKEEGVSVELIMAKEEVASANNIL
jgi:hypothetical protein